MERVKNLGDGLDVFSKIQSLEKGLGAPDFQNVWKFYHKKNIFFSRPWGWGNRGNPLESF